jgi:steroid delta-isomerase-like uncharacterized protein
MSERDEVQAVIDHLVEVMNTRDPAACAACYSGDAIVQDPRYPEPVCGRDIVREAFGYWFQAFPDVRIEVTDYTIDGNKVAMEWTFDGTHTGEYLGVPGSGRRIKAVNISHFWVQGGMVTRDFSVFDASTLRLLEELARA